MVWRCFYGDTKFGLDLDLLLFGSAIVKSSNLQTSFYDYTADYEYNYDFDYETEEIFKKKRRKSKAPQDYDCNYDYDYDYDYATEDDYCFHCGADVTILPSNKLETSLTFTKLTIHDIYFPFRKTDDPKMLTLELLSLSLSGTHTTNSLSSSESS